MGDRLRTFNSQTILSGTIWRQLTAASQRTVQSSLRSAFLRMSRGRKDRLGWTRLRTETKHEMPLFQSEGWSRGWRSRWSCQLQGHSVEAQVGLSPAADDEGRHKKCIFSTWSSFWPKLVLPDKNNLYTFFFKNNTIFYIFQAFQQLPCRSGSVTLPASSLACL